MTKGHTAVVTSLLVAALVAAVPASPARGAGRTDTPPIAEACRKDLAQRLREPLSAIGIGSVTPTVFLDGSLDLPEPGHVYTKGIQRGWWIIVKQRERPFLYAATNKEHRYGGPVSAWKLSVLTLQKAPPDGNLNEDLVQVSLIGTNPTLMARHVCDFYPQPDGTILAKRRTSRSGHEMLRITAPGEEKVVAVGLDVGPAAAAASAPLFACFVRPRLGTSWSLRVGALDGGKPEADLELPMGEHPHSLFWDDTHWVAVTRSPSGQTARRVVMADGRWTMGEPTPANWAIDRPILMSKSESLTVRDSKPGEPPGVRVVGLWFTGDERTIATIPEASLVEWSATESPEYVLVVVKRGETRTAYAVHVGTGERLLTVPKALATPRLLARPPLAAPKPVRSARS